MVAQWIETEMITIMTAMSMKREQGCVVVEGSCVNLACPITRKRSPVKPKFTNPTSMLTQSLSFCTVPSVPSDLARRPLQHLSCPPLAAAIA